MRIGHWDAQFGISGDMALGSLLDAGANLVAVNQSLERLGIPGLRATIRSTARSAIQCTAVQIEWQHTETAHLHRSYAEIERILSSAPLAAPVRERAMRVFAQLAAAEGKIHGCPPEDVCFHELGGEDTIADVVGSCAALEDLGIERLTVSSLPAGGGVMQAAHGQMPVPVPAVAVLLRGWLVHPGPVAAELVTPTGAALVAALADPHGQGVWPEMVVGGSGWGAGTRDYRDHPNATRFVWGVSPAAAAEVLHEELVEIETNIDDQSPEQIGYLFDVLGAKGALDVTVAPAWMKKQRPGVRLWVLARPEDAPGITECLFRESSSIGLRRRSVERLSLPRSIVVVDTPYGPVRVKVARLGNEVVNAAPEYEDCRVRAEERGVALKLVWAAALAGVSAPTEGPR